MIITASIRPTEPTEEADEPEEGPEDLAPSAEDRTKEETKVLCTVTNDSRRSATFTVNQTTGLLGIHP
jgi:hypothetical protein